MGLSVGMYGCTARQTDSLCADEVIPVDIRRSVSDKKEVIAKIELIPLETTDSCLVKGLSKFMYDREMDLFAIYGKKEQIAYTFRGNGRFVGSSEKRKGRGPSEYTMVVDATINPFLKSVDLLNPYGIVYSFTPSFEWKERRKLNPEFIWNNLAVVDSSHYVFTINPIWTDEEINMVDVDTQEISSMQYRGTIASDVGDRGRFCQVEDRLYFIPKGINYYIYRIDKKEKMLVPSIYLDFGKDSISTDGLPGRAIGERTKSDRKRKDIIKDMQERADYLRENQAVLPVRKFLNEKYVYILYAIGRQLTGHYIYNRETRKGYVVDTDGFIMHPCAFITDNILFAICDAYEVSQYVDTSLMSEEEIDKMRRITDEDNPVILKYHLKI